MSNHALARTLRDVFNQANPAPLAPGDRRYVDCTAVRGHDDVVTQLFKRITWSDEPATTQLFTGHRGCGKSTELLRLQARLQKANYAVIYFEADDVIDVEDVVYSDILVAIARQLFDGLNDMGIQLNQQLLEEIYRWFAEVVYTEDETDSASAGLQTEMSVGTPAFFSPLVSLFAKVTGQLSTSVEFKKEIRQRLDPRISELIDKINIMLREGTTLLHRQGKEGLVLIVDNLDRIPFRLIADGKSNLHDTLYIDHGEQLRACRCHLVYTVPIAMFYSPSAAILAGIFPDYAILPMIKTRTRQGEPWAAGLASMCEILGSRIALELMFEPAALDALCELSGGHPRLLMTLVRNACSYANEYDEPPLNLRAAERAISRLISEYSRSIPEEHFKLLAEVHRHKRVENDDPHRAMLHNLSVLEYMNGNEPWHDVQPAVMRLEKFKDADRTATAA